MTGERRPALAEREKAVVESRPSSGIHGFPVRESDIKPRDVE
jgi:hypothetical protein